MECLLYLFQIVGSFLKLRTFQVRYNGAFSATHVATAEVVQGSVISPLLYYLFISNQPPSPSNTDDTELLVQALSPRLINQRLQNPLADVEGRCKKWRVVINPNKSAAVLFTGRKAVHFHA